jgi:hypothetical protein
MAPSCAAQIDGWRARRIARVARRESALRVGHQDLAAWLPDGNRGALR